MTRIASHPRTGPGFLAKIDHSIYRSTKTYLHPFFCTYPPRIPVLAVPEGVPQVVPGSGPKGWHP
jgi:hypothetical protein